MHREDESPRPTTGTVESFDAARGVGTIRPDDGGATCTVSAAELGLCGIEALSSGDRVRFRVREEAGVRTATDLALVRAIQRWENEGGAPDAGAPGG